MVLESLRLHPLVGPPVRRNPGWLAVGVGPTALFVLFVGFPLVAIFVRGLGEAGFWPSLIQEVFLDALRLSFITSIISLTVVALIGTPLAYYLARARFRGKEILEAFIELPIVVPPVVVGLAMLMAFGRNGLIGEGLAAIGVSLPFTMTAVIFAQIFVGASFYIRAAKIGFEAVDHNLEDIAQTLGVTPARTFFRVSLPLASRAITGGLFLCWARGISEFGATIMFAGNLPGRTQTMPLAILSALESDLDAALALAAVLVVISLVVLVVVRFGLRARWTYGS